MNQNDLASLLSSVGNGGGAPGLMQGSQRDRVVPDSSDEPVTSILDAFSQPTPDSRPNTAPAGTRATGTATATPATGGTTSASATRPAGSSSTAAASKPRNGGTSSSPSTVTPASGASSGTAGGPKGGAIQMSALSNILANLSGTTPTQGGAAGGSAKPAIDLYDIMNSEVNRIISIEERRKLRDIYLI